MIGALRAGAHPPQRLLPVLLALLLLAASVRAAPPTALRFTTADGLPSNAVHQVVEDGDGYLWFATDDGLARFDGQRFRIWRMEQGLADNQLLSMATDAQDRLWIGTAQGHLMRMSADRSHIERFDRARFPALAGVAIGVVLPAPDGVVWFGTRDAGLFRLGPAIGCVSTCPPRTRTACRTVASTTWRLRPTARSGWERRAAWRAGATVVSCRRPPTGAVLHPPAAR